MAEHFDFLLVRVLEAMLFELRPYRSNAALARDAARFQGVSMAGHGAGATAGKREEGEDKCEGEGIYSHPRTRR